MSNNLSMSTKISNWCLQLNRRLDFQTSFAKVACKKCELSLSAVTSWWRDYQFEHLCLNPMGKLVINSLFFEKNTEINIIFNKNWLICMEMIFKSWSHFCKLNLFQAWINNSKKMFGKSISWQSILKWSETLKHDFFFFCFFYEILHTLLWMKFILTSSLNFTWYNLHLNKPLPPPQKK